MSNKKKKKNKAKKYNKSTFAIIQKTLTTIGGIAGSIMAIYGLIKTFRDDADGYSWLLVLGGAIWLIALLDVFRKQKTYAYLYLAVTIVGGVAGWVGWQGQVQEKEDKVIVLIAKFDGPEEEYGLRDEMIEQLRDATKSYKDTEIVAADETVTVAQGSEYARELGGKYQADLVIWAWYKQTDDPNITIHIENMSIRDVYFLDKSEIYRPEATLVDLESFEIQRKLGSETSTLITFISGVAQFKSGQTSSAISRIEKLLSTKDLSTYINPRDINYTLSLMHYSLGEIAKSLYYVEEAIQLDPNSPSTYNLRGLIRLDLGDYNNSLLDFNTTLQHYPSAAAYNNRGIANHRLGQLDDALKDYTQSIQLDPRNPEPYDGRAMIQIRMKDYESAIVDLETAIALRPEYADAYGNLGVAYYELGQFDQAMDNFNKALQIDPEHAVVYYDRGNLYQFKLNKIDLAVDDYTKAIELGGTTNSVYIHRCNAYTKLRYYELALQDCNKAVELMPDLAVVYDNRAYLLELMGRASEAKADLAKYNELINQDTP